MSVRQKKISVRDGVLEVMSSILGRALWSIELREIIEDSSVKFTVFIYSSKTSLLQRE